MKVDTTNTDPKYWDRVLKKARLAPIADDEIGSEIAPPPAVSASGRKNDSHVDNFQLRNKIDSRDSFFDGYQINKVRRRRRATPLWALDNTEVRRIIDLAFPTWRTNKTKHARAASWVRVIHLYFRMGLSKSEVSGEMKISYNKVHNIVNKMRRVASGKRADNKARITPSAPQAGD